jgi:NAD(P)-dependent dehydrogenase (short-subunit alcohol dehydrogenase family)
MAHGSLNPEDIGLAARHHSKVEDRKTSTGLIWIFKLLASLLLCALLLLRIVEFSNLYTSAMHHFAIHLSLLIIAWHSRPTLGVLVFAFLYGLAKYQLDVAVYSPPATTNLSGSVAVVTGANSGIGLALSQQLAEMGATVVMGCRSVGKCTSLDVAGDTHCLELDLADLQSVRVFALSVLERFPRVDYLINNAGLVGPPGRRTKQGLEENFGVMHVGHFLLSQLLLPALQMPHPHGTPSRIVNHASAAMYGGYLHESLFVGNGEGDMRGEITDGCPSTFNDVLRWLGNVSNTKYSGPCPVVGSYSRAKFAQVLFTRELQRRLDVDTSTKRKVIASTLHPGTVQSGIVQIWDFLVRPTHVGANVLMYCLLEQYKPGSYIDEMMRPHDLMRSDPWSFPMSLPAQNFQLALGQDSDVKVQGRLWEVSHHLVAQYMSGVHTIRQQ